MSTMTTTKARREFADLVNRSAYGKERVVLTRGGKSLAVVVPFEDFKLLQELEDRLDVEAAQKALKQSKNIPWDKIKKGLKL